MSHHISNNTETTASQNGVDLTQAKADIVAIKAKTDQITITNPANLSTMESNISTNNAKVGITTTQASDITTNNAKVGITTTQANNITTNNSKITYPASASTKLALIGITSSVNLNSLVTQSNTNVSDITTLNTAYPRNTIVSWVGNQTGNIFFDGNITLNWDGTNKQLRFSILSIASNQYMTGGVKITKPTSQGIQISNYLSLGVSTAFKYFTGSQIPASSSILNSTYNMLNYSRAVYWLQPFSLSSFPTYEISVFMGSSSSYLRIHIKKYNN